MDKPVLGFWRLWNISFGFFGIQIGFALQNANASRIFQTLGADIDALPVLWLAAPLTGLLVQPVVGHFSDRTWIFGGRRRPYFLVGAIFTTAALLAMPNAPYLWVAAVMLWVLDASINISMEPFRAFVGDMLPARQRTAGYAMQTVFIGAGAVFGSALPYILHNWLGIANTAPEGAIPDTVRIGFYVGGAALFLAILWTVLTSREYPPEELARFEEPESPFRSEAEEAARQPASAGFFARAGAGFAIAGALICGAVYRFAGDKQLYVLGGGLAALGVFFLINAFLKRRRSTDNFLSHILSDLTTMPTVMRRLAVVQFFSWFALFIMWVYAVPAVTSFHYGTSDPTSEAYNQGADWVGLMFSVYNGVAALYAFVLPWIAKKLGERAVHALNLIAGAAALGSFYVITDPALLMISMVGIGMAWASILTMPYAILSECLPSEKMGVYMGIFNFFIVLPQITVVGIMSVVLRRLLGGEAILVFLLAAAGFLIAAAAMAFVRARAPTPASSPSGAS